MVVWALSPRDRSGKLSAGLFAVIFVAVKRTEALQLRIRDPHLRRLLSRPARLAIKINGHCIHINPDDCSD